MARWWTRLLAGWRRRASLGRRGERVARRFLRRRGYRILHQNYRLAGVEADLLAIDPDGRTVVIVEVKTRRAGDTAAEDRIDLGKRRRLARLGAQLQRLPRFADRPLRFDSVAVVCPDAGRPTIRHLVAAFDSPY